MKASEIPLPPIEEQRRIAAILDSADALRAKRRQALAKLDTLTQAIFIDMFGDALDQLAGGTGDPLASVCLPLRNGAYYPKDKYVSGEGGTEMVHMSDGFYGLVQRGELKRVEIDESDISKYGLTENDVLVARRSLNFEGSVKPCRIPRSTEPLIFESSLIRLTPMEDRVTTGFLYALLSSEKYRRAHVFPVVTGATISGISQKNLAKLPVPNIPLVEQRRFDARVTATKATSQVLTSSSNNLDELFASLQQRAFRGDL